MRVRKLTRLLSLPVSQTFGGLSVIGGSLVISNNPLLKSIADVNLTSVQSVFIVNNPALLNLPTLHVQSLTTLVITGSDKLSSLGVLPSVVQSISSLTLGLVLRLPSSSR